ncbi:MAG: 16S rRNA (adenine(1518)-N(6)/adenine(1519)-N(6))-dimethyltransferase RsmA [Bacilli bacterium]|jgi:16S rRNA (adenine1518-N6/adenine1519-N6)-dimethyltransferase
MNNIKTAISDNNFNFKKKYGQNFLIDENIVNKIVASADIKSDTMVIEVGVGAGILTNKLALVSKNVVGYEIDEKLQSIIDNYIKNDNVEIIYDDFLKRDVKKDLEKYEYKNLYVVANLPYYITTPIITKLIEEDIDIDKLVIMVQKEVGERLNAKPDTKEYNSLTIFINYYFEVSKLFDVSRNVFIPKPNVDSSIMLLKKKDNQWHLNNEQAFFKLVHSSFQYKRKTLRNNLKGYDLDKIALVLKHYNLDLSVRAEHLTIKQFIDIANNL